MPDVPLTGGSYRAKSIIAGAQRCVNLFPEKNEDTAPSPYTYYPRGGNRLKITGPGATARCSYRATNGQLFEVVGPLVFYTDPGFVRHLLGSIAAGSGLVYMSDNGQIVLLVDGTTAGYTINLSAHTFSTISDSAFYGSTSVDYIDTVFLLNRPNTTQFYISPPNWNGATPFDALDIANKIGGASKLQIACANAGNIQLVGELDTEIWYDAGGADFQFSRVPSVFIEHGTPAPYSVAQTDVGVYFLSQDDDGGAIILKISGYEAKRITTHAIEAAISKYVNLADCIAMTFQQEGHAFVRFTFPSADATWVWDEATELWHEETWTDDDGLEHRHRANCTAYAYGINVLGDWENGSLYQADMDLFVDQGIVDHPIVYRRGFPHIVREGKRQIYTKFIANMEVGSAAGLFSAEEPLVSLRWSDTRGASWGDPVTTGMGATGQYDRWVTWWQLGLGQDRVFELFWSAPYKTALMGAFIDAKPSLT